MDNGGYSFGAAPRLVIGARPLRFTAFCSIGKSTVRQVGCIASDWCVLSQAQTLWGPLTSQSAFSLTIRFQTRRNTGAQILSRSRRYLQVYYAKRTAEPGDSTIEGPMMTCSNDAAANNRHMRQHGLGASGAA